MKYRIVLANGSYFGERLEVDHPDDTWVPCTTTFKYELDCLTAIKGIHAKYNRIIVREFTLD